jgi:hypothetical protein
MNFWLDAYNAAMEGEYLAEKADMNADYDAACARRQRLMDEAEVLCDELEVRLSVAEELQNWERFYRLSSVLNHANARYNRRAAADVEV